ncbi:MAG TPA: single-stranded DNA-binding protein [Verrucomicrobiae bacterium]|nr:single-stranded DNA-binding protein [Verrucomicrobiae bacterium]
MNYNKLILAGHLTRDPELSFTGGGTAICKIGMAVNRTWKTSEGEKREEVVFVDVDSFGKIAEAIGRFFKKGSAIFIDGRLKLDQWQDKATGRPRSKLGIIAESFCFVGAKADHSDGPAQDTRRSAPARTAPNRTSAPATAHAAAQPADDDVPF